MTPSRPPIVRPTRTLPFDQLPWDDFERLCLWLVERNHNDAFWERLARIIPDYADRQRWLKERGGIYDLQ